MIQAKRIRGKVTWYDVDRGFGFITLDEPEDDMDRVFVHISAARRAGLFELRIGDRLVFQIERRHGERPRAAAIETVTP